MAAITAIAAYCDGNGNKRCADNCRGQLDYVAPPVKSGGLSTAELTRYLQQHPDVSAVRAMRKEPATPEQATRYWVLCASGGRKRPLITHVFCGSGRRTKMPPDSIPCPPEAAAADRPASANAPVRYRGSGIRAGRRHRAPPNTG